MVQNSPDTYFTLVSGHMSVVSNDGAGTSTPVDQILGERGWTLPYDRATVCAAVTCGSGGIYGPGPTQFISAGVSSTTVTGQPTWRKLVPTFGIKGPIVLPTSWPNLTWAIAGLTLKFASSGRLDVVETLDVSGATLTAATASQGWAGVRFLPGSGGAWTNGTIVERVLGEEPGNQTVEGVAAVTVTGASPTFTDVIIQQPVTGTFLDGLTVIAASGYTTAPVATRTSVSNMTSRGVTVNGAARLDLRRGTISGSTATGLTTSGGSTTDAYLYPFTDGTTTRGPSITGNTGGGIAAAGGSEVRFGTDNATAPGYGLATVAQNPGRGLSATGGSLIDAGSGTVGAGKYQRNRVFLNATSNATTGNALASGTSSRVYARCAWWTTGETYPFRTGQASGGLVDVSYYLTADPYTTSTPPCMQASVIDPGRAGGAGVRAAGLNRGTPAAEASALDRLAEAMSAATASEAVSLLASLVAEMPETEAAAAALGEAAVIAGRTDAPAAASALLDGATESAHGALRVAAWQGLVSSRRAQGNASGALAAADVLALEGGAAVAAAEVARVYLHAEAGDEAAALAALESLEALAPGSVEADLARAFLGLEAPAGGRGTGTPALDARGTVTGTATGTAADASVTLALSPNPASSSAAVTLTLAGPADVTVTVYDLLGRAVATPLTGTLAAGTHRAAVDVSGLAPGVYVVRTTANNGTGPVVKTARLTVTR